MLTGLTLVSSILKRVRDSLFRFALIGTVLVCLPGGGEKAAADPLIDHVWTDKAQYHCGDTVTVSVRLKNETGMTWRGYVIVNPTHLGHSLGIPPRQLVTLPAGNTQTLTFDLSVDSAADRGYLAEVMCSSIGGGGVIETSSTAFDFSSDWTKFPRYGFLTQFNEPAVASDLIDPLRDYKINVIQYYDWMDEHHIPYRSGHDYWQDLAARSPWVSKAKLNELIALGHSYNISAMAYNLMFGAYADYQSNSDVDISWGAFVSTTGELQEPTLAEQDRHEINVSGWETPRLYLFNPGNQGWRSWMAQKFQLVYSNIFFDGWHIDTLGDRGQLYDFDGEPFDLANEYPGFVNYMRGQLGANRRLVVNTVSNYGLSQVAQNADVDAVYSELWDGAMEDEFFDLGMILNTIRGYTTKSSVIAGYVNHTTAKSYSSSSPGMFNEPSVLLADAAIFAHGGWHIELGDGLNMLCNEYYPNRNLLMSESTKERLLDYYNFAVAYENLLRDEIVDGNLRIDYDAGGSTPSGYVGAAGEVWKISKYRGSLDCTASYEIAHLINLQSAGSTVWRDPDSLSTAPTEILNKPVRLYYNGGEGDFNVWYASPDVNGGQAVQVTSYTDAFDAVEGKRYIAFTLPRLEYWTMVWLERAVEGHIHDLRDFADFQLCNGSVAGECAKFDFDGNGVLDAGDLEKIDCFLTGPR